MSGIESTWKLVLGIIVFVVFACFGIANLLKPNIRNLRKGGEMLTGWNRFQVRWFAALFTAFAIYGIYELLKTLIRK